MTARGVIRQVLVWTLWICAMAGAIQWSRNGRAAAPVPLHYVFEGTQRAWVGTGVLTIRNVNAFTWTDVRVEAGVRTVPSGDDLHFECRSPSTVASGQILAVPFRECASPLPAGTTSARMSALRIRSREGDVQQKLEPGLVIVEH